MAQATLHVEARAETARKARLAVVAWVLTAVYYFYQYALRSEPAVMMPELSNAFNTTALGVASIVGLFYYGYSPFSLIAGAAMDRVGPRRLLPAVMMPELSNAFNTTALGVASIVGLFYYGYSPFS